MLSRFSRVRLCATLWTAAHQAPQSMGFSRPRILEWIAMPFSRGSSRPRDQTHVSYVYLHWQAGSLPQAPRGFNSWSGKISHTVEQLSPCAATTEPEL